MSKIDSNITGLRIAEEETLGALPVTPVWNPYEPNSYSDFGGQITTVAREPIKANRQRSKGVTVDLDASGGFQSDLVQTGLMDLWQGFFFADTRAKESLATTAVVDGGVSDDSYTVAADGDNFAAGDIIFVSGFLNGSNNGRHLVTSGATATSIPVAESLTPETAAGTIYRVGIRAASGDLDVDASGSLPALTSTVLDFTTLGLIPGEWIYLGGDAAGTQFVNTANRGFARVRAIEANRLTFDKTNATFITETGTGLTVEIFFGDVLRNENDPDLIIRRTYQLERTLGQDANGTQSEYIVGAVPNELTINIPVTNKVTVDMSFVGTDVEQRDGLTGVKTGDRPSLTIEDAFNTSTDVRRKRLAIVSDTEEAPADLFAYVNEITINVSNNLTPNKAIGVLGSFDISAGMFTVGGRINAYFFDVAAVQAIRNNADVTVDVILARENAGMVFDVPLLGLGDGRLNVEQNQPITLPLEVMAAESVFGHTLLVTLFRYLPSVATP